MQDSGHLEKKEKQMKKFIGPLVIASLIGGAAFAQSTNVVSSANVVGYNQITIPSNQYVMVSMQFDNTNNTVQGLFPALPSGSKAYIWNPSAQGYIICSRGPANWGTSGTNRVVKGSGIFLQGPANFQTNIYLSGDVPTTETTMVSRLPGYTMMSYPYPVDVTLTNMAVAKGAVSGNKIYFWNGTGYSIYSRGPANWGASGTNVFKVGQAYYFQGSVTTNANEVKPYTLQ